MGTAARAGMTKIAIAATLFLLASTSALAEQDRWTTADLQAAAKEGQFVEALQHLTDVAPSKRDAAWKKVTDEIALGFLDYCAKQEDPIAALMMGEEILMRFPSVRKSRVIMSKRAEVGMKGFESCFDRAYDGSVCHEALLKFVDNDAQNAELAFSAGQLVRRNQFHYVATPYFRRAVTAAAKPRRAAMCKHEDVGLAVVAGLGLPKDHVLAKDSRELASSCFEEQRKAILAAVVPNGGYVLDNACPLLQAKNALAGRQARVCAEATARR